MKGAAQCGGVVVESKLQPTIDAPCTSAGTVTVCSHIEARFVPARKRSVATTSQGLRPTTMT
jgi:hypothetical protein